MKKLTRNTQPTEPNSAKNQIPPVESGGTPVNIGDRVNSQQVNNTNPQAHKQGQPPENAKAKQSAPMPRAGRFQRGQSGNPQGRPKNSPNKANQTIRTLLESSAPQLLAKAIELALAGNPTALKLCFDRIAPQRRSVNLARLAKLTTGTKEAESVLAAHNAVLEAVASGEITPQEGQSVSAIVDARRRSWESMEMEEQISDLQDCADDARSNRKPKIVWQDSPSEHSPRKDQHRNNPPNVWKDRPSDDTAKDDDSADHPDANESNKPDLDGSGDQS